tara:strand:- start:287 stop:688 length:402 start_codon:yes stop_codon:yes gene_type:complete
MDIGHWKCDCDWATDCFGFIYEIQNIQTGKKYIGKKQVQRTLKRPPLKGKKNKRHTIMESDWKEYTGSSNKLNEDISRSGKENFAFTILRLCYNKWELSYFETELQFKLGVLLSDEYYNGIINCRIGKKPSHK